MTERESLAGGTRTEGQFLPLATAGGMLHHDGIVEIERFD
jgi:hypothetical protein